MAQEPLDDASSIGATRSIADTGCGYNLVPRSASAAGAPWGQEEPVFLHTAGGLVRCNERMRIACVSLTEGRFDALVLDDTPEVISIGQRCMEYGYGFYWPPWSSDPYLLTPAGDHVVLEVDDYVPYLVVSGAAPANPSSCCSFGTT